MLIKTLFLIVLLSFGDVSGSRVRRHLVFSEGSRLFSETVLPTNCAGIWYVPAEKNNKEHRDIKFCTPKWRFSIFKSLKVVFIYQFSVDVRDNLFDYSSNFAQVFGVKMDWFLPTNIVQNTKIGRLQRRDLYQGMEHLLRRQNLNETSCVRKFLCEASVSLPKSNHFLAQLYEIILSANDRDVREAYKIDDSENQCAEVLNLETKNNCPLSVMSIFPKSDSDFNILVN